MPPRWHGVETATVIASDALAADKGDFFCDGTTDDVEIQAAIASLPSGGGEVLLSEGTFNIAASIVPANNVALEGMGESTILFAVAGLDDDVIGTPASGTLSDAQFRHFKVDGNRNNTASGHGIYLYAPRFCAIEYVTVVTCDDDGIHIAGAASPNQGFYNWIRHNHVNLCDGVGIYIEGTEFNWVTENIVRFVTGNGIEARVGSDLIMDNLLDSVTGDSIHVEFGAGRWTITDNDIDRPLGDGIIMRRNDFGICSGNKINNLLTGMVAIRNGNGSDASENGDNLIIEGNQVGIKSGETSTVGIGESRASDACVYRNNHLVGLATAISTDGSSTNLIVEGNKGYVTENGGATSVADGGTISHGLTTTPTYVTVTPSTSSEMVSVTALGTTTFTVAIKQDDGTAGTTATVYWRAVLLS